MKLSVASYDQRRASDPQRSVWVAANAGSGKTHVLVDRVIRLMLSGTPPDKILCITFTKAAAAEMASRLHGRLGKWVVLEDADLVQHIRAMGHADVTAETLRRARELFTLALETPGGLKIQTIHAFCERLLQLFPVEAGVVPGFEVMDERSAAELLDQARRRIIAEAETADDPALKRIVARAQAEAFDELLRTILIKRSDLSLDLDYLRRELGLGVEDTAASLEAELMEVDAPLYERMIETLECSAAATDRKSALALRRVKAGDRETLRDLFLKKDLKPKALSSVVGKKMQTAEPWLAEALECEMDRVVTLLGKLATDEMMLATEALVTLAAGIINDYERLKRLYGRYDFEDLILRTRRLLVEQVSAAWVLFKLDGGIDHILVDEAQDTSPAQWQIVKALAQEFFSGAGARGEAVRTLFVVGDRKQSIFSFQGADPAAFEETRTYFESRLSGADGLDTVSLSISYRSTRTVLEAVDAVFAGGVARQGLISEGDSDVLHQAVRKGHAGLIELWPVTRKDDKPDYDPWLVPVDRIDRNHPARKLAQRIAETIAQWLREKRIITALGRPVTPGDILILVRSRNDFFSSMLRELNRCRVPVAGADRVTLNDHIAIQDLLALGQFIVLPEDDHALACLLKSPLISHPDGRAFDDDDLFALAFGRGRRSLWQCLAENAALHTIVARLRRWIDWGGKETPFGFYARVLGEDMPSVRQNILSRLGPEAVDLIDAFLNLALDYEQRETPSLQGFLHWFTSADTEIRRDMDQSGDVVRIMTVHGAKGLEANIVFLPDTCAPPDDRNEVQPLMLPAPEGKLIPFWRFGGGVEAPQVTAKRELLRVQRLDEYRRQLYVALTRARDELYICGYTSDDEPKAGSWYALVEASLAGERDGDGLLRIADVQAVPPAAAVKSAPEPEAATESPAWLTEKPPRELAGHDWINPSRLVRKGPVAPSAAMEQGRALHRLFQLLPDLPPERRKDAALEILDRRGITGAAAQSLADKVAAIIEDPAYARYFVGNGFAEIPLMAELGTQGLLAGQVDRLVVGEEEVLILDYKSDRVPPAELSAVPEAYIAQLAAYRAALTRMFPERRVTAALLWTEAPRLMVIPSEMLDRVMPAM
ncbi:double-strand break repair helicase AddA [Nordella sp. HKS 07]|uniref:double-strand break repair helicase AddA n=1 Tax=Nordella sp. HKS 07 TaxID=2712222 RepID=UPI0013E0F68B|nr:double-strand break repair helicase AddA [Nordella sp. HKS 07]QIG48683.1 double-strand break repair helicase AddA [Nordella sp. HKS 07]